MRGREVVGASAVSREERPTGRGLERKARRKRRECSG
jgi:hypothetical protein